MKQNRIDIANNTLQILDKGNYQFKGNTVDIAGDVEASVMNARLYSPESLDRLLREANMEKSNSTNFIVENETTLDAAKKRIDGSEKWGVLNFASAKNPGGGFMNGAQSQEESIARSSSLYPTIDQFQEMYAFNRSRRTYLYSDYMLYSPGVVVFKNDEGTLLENPYLIDVLTSPAVNVGAILNNKPEEMEQVEEVMLKRIDKMLALFVHHGCANLILGAWGCGVFRNNPTDMAHYFEQYLKNGGKYEGVFNTVVFAVLDRNDRGIYNAFKSLEQ